VEPVAPLEKLLKPEDVAEVLKTSARQVRRMTVEGQLHGVVVGKRLRITPESVRRFMRGGT
jgi:excisionase family DNA binding protein